MGRRKSNPEVKIKKIAEEARWKPEDDLKLKVAIEQVNDLSLVHSAIKFSSYFKLEDLEARWNALLFNKQVSLSSKYEISKLPEDHKLNVIRQAALFSDEETAALQKVGVIEKPSISFFTSLLDLDYNKSSRVFHSSRSPHCLLNQWQLLYKYDLLEGQRIPHPSLSRHHDVAINNIEEKEPTVEAEAEIHARWNRKQIIKLEEEILALESYLNRGEAIGKIKANFTNYSIPPGQSIVTIGRGQDVDCDLTKEINSSRIHRRQAEIYIKDVNGMKSFSIKNIGHRVVFVNGNQLLMDDQIDLSHQSLIQMENIDLFFTLTPSS